MIKSILAELFFSIQEALFLRHQLTIANENGWSVDTPLFHNDIHVPPGYSTQTDFYRWDKTGICSRIHAYATHTASTPAAPPPRPHPLSRMHFIEPGTPRLTLRPDTLYILLHSPSEPRREVLRKYRADLCKPTTHAVLLDKTVARLLFNQSILIKPEIAITFHVTHKTPLYERMLLYISMLVLSIATYFCNLKIVASLEEKDPLLSDFVINSAHILKYKDCSDAATDQTEMKNCTICFEEFKEDEEVRMLDCKHFFHIDCVDRWLIGHSNHCPYCRAEIEVVERV